MSGPKTGHKMKLYRNSGTTDTPVWSLVDEVGDVSIPDLARGMAELKRRASDFTKNLASLIQSFHVEFRLHHGMDATTYNSIRYNFFNGVAEEWAVMDGSISVNGNQGLRVPVLVEEFPWDQPLEEVSGYDVRLIVAFMVDEDGDEVDPAWYYVGGDPMTTTTTA